MRGHRVMTLGSVENDVNLASKMSNPSESLNATFFITANKGASNTSTPALRTGSTWKPGSELYVRNSATVTGATGANGSPGSTGSTGTPGNGGPGGAGGSGNTPSLGANGSPGTSGSTGGTGGTGGTGTPGSNGGPSLVADVGPPNGIRVMVDNAPGTLTGGPGGPGGPGGGGGGGGGAGYANV